MAAALSIPIFAVLALLQSAVISRMLLLQGTADLVLLVLLAWVLQRRVQAIWPWAITAGLLVNLTTALPVGIPLLGYGLATALALVLRQRLWRAPLLAMFIATLGGTLLVQGIALLVVTILGSNIPLGQAMNLIILPSAFINLLLVLPVFSLIGDLASWLYPEELEV